MNRLTKTKKRRILLVLIIFLLVIFFVSGNLFLKMAFGHGIPCQTKLLLGIECPGCGTTRMLESILHGEIYRGFRYNPAMFFLLPLLISFLTAQAVVFIQECRILKHLDSFMIFYASILLLFGILRNIPSFSFLNGMS